MIGWLTPGEWEWRAFLAEVEARSWHERSPLDDLVDAIADVAVEFGRLGVALTEAFRADPAVIGRDS